MFSQFLEAEMFKIKVLAWLIPSEGHEGRIVSGLCPWLVDGHLFSVSSHGLPSVSKVPLIRTPLYCMRAHANDLVLIQLPI